MSKSKNINRPVIDLGNITTYQSGVIQASAYRALKKHTDACLKEYDLTTMQWLVIGTVFDSGREGIRITELAQKLGTTLSFLTHSINLLASRNILERASHDDDSRSKVVTVTNSYRPNCKKIEAELRSKLRASLYADLTPEELRIYIRVLQHFTQLKM